MKTMIAFADNENKGKSSTLNILIDILSSVSDFSEIHRDSDIDSWAWFEIDGKRIFIGTAGDDAQTIRENINYTKQYDCDIGITGFQTTPETDKEYEKQIKIGIPFILVQKAKIEKKIILNKPNNHAKNRIIAAKLFQELFKTSVPDLANKDLEQFCKKQ